MLIIIATQSGALLDSSTFIDTIFVFKHKVYSDSFLTWGHDNKYQESVNWGKLHMDGTFKSTWHCNCSFGYCFKRDDIFVLGRTGLKHPFSS